MARYTEPSFLTSSFRQNLKWFNNIPISMLSFYGGQGDCNTCGRDNNVWFGSGTVLKVETYIFLLKTSIVLRWSYICSRNRRIILQHAGITFNEPQSLFICEISVNQSYNSKMENQDLPPPKLRVRRSKSFRDDFTDEELVDEPKQEGSFLFSFLCDFINLYSYAETAEKVAIAFGVIFGIGSGASHPLFVYLWFQEIGLAIEYRNNLQQKMGTFRNYLFYYIALGFGILVVNSILFVIWKYVSQSISKRIRIRYLQQFAKQTLACVERRNGYEWASDFRTHTLNIEKSIGDKVALFFNLIGITAFGIIGALVLRWTYTLWLLLVAPIGAIAVMYFIYVQIKKRDVQAEANKEAQNKALEATAMVKTVKMLGSESKEAAAYEEKLQGGQSQLGEFSKRIGLATSLFYFIINCIAGVGFIMGIQCVRGTSFCPVQATGSRYKLDEFLSVLFIVFFCAFNFLQLASNYSAIKSAILSSKRIYNFINRPKVVKQEEVVKPERIQQISFQNVTFSYPLTRDRVILRNLNMELLRHKFNAIAGVTGSGKSTIVQLLLKQYEPLSGVIRVGGVPLDEINTSHWLDKVGIVSQEPTLFLGTIRENVLVGKAGATDEEIRQALKNANILEFVDSQAEGLDFQIGAGGSKLSGGQKQRIAIARALVKRPELLILDEATSALDPSAEKEIQESLDRIRRVYDEHMTIVCIAHRLRTIKNADKVFLVQNGAISQSGKFDDLDYFRQIREQEEADLKIDQGTMFKMLVDVFDQVNNPLELLLSGNDLANIAFTNKAIVMNSSVNFLDTEALPAQKIIQNEKSIYSQLYSYTKRRTWYVICLILAAIGGFNHNATAILISYSTDQMAKLYLFGTEANWCESSLPVPQQIIRKCHDTLDGYFYQSQKYLYGLIGLSVFVLVVYYVKVAMLSKIQAQISFNLRKGLYKKLLSLEVKYFQQLKNQSGQAASQFSNDSRDCSNLLTSYIPILVENFCCAILAVVVCFAFDWRFGLLTIFIPPLIALSFYIAMLFIGGYEDSSLQQRHQADQIANQFITSFKTILVLDYQNRMLEKYRKAISEPFLSTIKTGGKIGLLYGSGHLILDNIVGLALYFSIIVSKENPTIPSLSITIFMISAVYTGFIVGNNFYFISHTSASKAAGARIMDLINAKTEQEAQMKHRTTAEALHISKSQAKGKIQFRNVTFKYKKDDSKPVLRNISLTIEAGSKVAFVGPSGCGKSTLLQLLLRFYQFSGEILFDGKNIYEYDLNEYRQQFTMINQEPSLFAGTINDNIIYNINEITEERIQEVCEKSCAYSLSQEEGIQERIKNFRERKVGPKGSNISGGEKQRAACARALARGGSVFLMDEGTSALDRRTEMRLQTGVNEVFQGKTVINVAHRMETISKSDVIFVFDSGKLKEMGNYSQLMNKKAYFYNFVNGNKAHE